MITTKRPAQTITTTRFPAVPECTRCDNDITGGAIRVQVRTSNPKVARTTDWLCIGCAQHLGLI